MTATRSSMPPAMSRVRASLVLARLDWVKKHHGPDARSAILESLPTKQAEAIRGAVIPSLWVPFDAFVALCEAIDKKHGNGDLALCRALARHSAEVNLPTLYRIFYKLGTPEYILSKASAVWSAHYDTGAASVRKIPGGVALTVERFATPHPVHCLTVLGWAEQSVAISGAKLQKAVESQCRNRGATACEFQILYES